MEAKILGQSKFNNRNFERATGAGKNNRFPFLWPRESLEERDDDDVDDSVYNLINMSNIFAF